jgi:flagella basal body P-ring formation protein FlgA
VATQLIHVGEPLIYGGNYGLFRVKADDRKGLSGSYYDQIEGSVAKRMLAPGDTIGPKDIL